MYRSASILLLACGVLFGFLIDADLPHMLWLVGAAMVVALWPATRIEGRQRLLVLATLAAAMLTSGIKDDLFRLVDGKVRVWNVYHYYIGAKYFPELGYTDLYLASLAADREGENYWTEEADKLRSLTTYKVAKITPEDLAYDRTQHFTDGRWDQFKADLAALAPHRSANGWRNVFRDRGYNGTPVWTVIGRTFGALVPADSSWLLALVALDLILLSATGVLFYRTFGAAMSTFGLLLFVASPANVARLVGGFLQTDWLCALLAGVCFLQRKRPVLAGVLVAYALTTRAFPVVMVAAAGLALIAEQLWRKRNARGLIRHLTFYLAIGIASIAGIGLGAAGNGRGLHGWVEFKQAIDVHRTVHVIGDRRIGLEHVFTQDIRDFGKEVKDSRRAELLSSQRPLFLLSALALGVLLVIVAARSSEFDAFVLATAGIFAVLVLSRYYFGALALLPLITLDDKPRRQLIVGGQLGVFFGFFWLAQWLPDQHALYAALNALLALYFFAVLAYLAWTKRTQTDPVYTLQR